MKPARFIPLTAWGLLLVLLACVQLQSPDPFVVRAEQVQTTARTMFDAVGIVAARDRDFWESNLAEFALFADSLKQGNAIQAVETLKLDYLAGTATSNQLDAAVSRLAATGALAEAWLTVTTSLLQ